MFTPQTLLSVTANGIEFSYYEKRPVSDNAPLVLCLHGFPDTAYTFIDLAEALAAEGYRVVVPFMRGYHPSAQASNGDYSLPTLARDVVALIEELYEGEGESKAALIGHDWGGLTAYHTANLAPEKVTALTVLAVPHMGSAKMSWQQFKNIWYTLFFQLPKLPEYVIRRNDFGFIDFLYRLWSPNWDNSSAHRAAIKSVMGQPGAVEATLGYYRCMVQKPTDESKQLLQQSTSVPALWVMGEEDRCVHIGQVSHLEKAFTAGIELLRVKSGHFPHSEQPAQVTTKILQFLQIRELLAGH